MVKFCHKTYTCVAFPLFSFISLHTLSPSVWNPSPFCPKPFTLLLETLYPFAWNPLPFLTTRLSSLPKEGERSFLFQRGNGGRLTLQGFGDEQCKAN